jgi:hypothetical protein
MRITPITALALILVGAATASQPRAWGLDFETEEVRFQSGGNTLAGTLHRPVKPGPHAALVLVLGSGPMDRAYGGVGTALARYFARHGFACLSWGPRVTEGKEWLAGAQADRPFTTGARAWPARRSGSWSPGRRRGV